MVADRRRSPSCHRTPACVVGPRWRWKKGAGASSTASAGPATAVAVAAGRSRRPAVAPLPRPPSAAVFDAAGGHAVAAVSAASLVTPPPAPAVGGRDGAEGVVASLVGRVEGGAVRRPLRPPRPSRRDKPRGEAEATWVSVAQRAQGGRGRADRRAFCGEGADAAILRTMSSLPLAPLRWSPLAFSLGLSRLAPPRARARPPPTERPRASPGSTARPRSTRRTSRRRRTRSAAPTRSFTRRRSLSATRARRRGSARW